MERGGFVGGIAERPAREIQDKIPGASGHVAAQEKFLRKWVRRGLVPAGEVREKKIDRDGGLRGQWEFWIENGAAELCFYCDRP